MSFIFTIISILLIAQSTVFVWKKFKNEGLIYRQVYFQKPLDWFYASCLVFLMFVLISIFNSLNPPEFLRFSWMKLIQSDTKGANLIVTPMISSGSKIITCLFFSLLALLIPYLAKSEEEVFRVGAFFPVDRIKKSLVFGLVHMIVGAPLYIALFIGLIGWFFSVRYVKTLKRTLSEKEALISATSLHAKYNFIIMLIACSIVVFLT